MHPSTLIERLSEANPGWGEWDDLIALARRLEFEFFESEYMGSFLLSGNRLCFSHPPQTDWPDWLPSYVSALRGMNADNWEMAGGYATVFTGAKAIRGGVFSVANNDAALGYPEFEIPDEVYPFQMNSHGGLFHVDSNLNVVYPNADKQCMSILDPIEAFTKKCIQKTIDGASWFDAYGFHALESDLVD